jgi:hypothetical protein
MATSNEAPTARLAYSIQQDENLMKIIRQNRTTKVTYHRITTPSNPKAILQFLERELLMTTTQNQG